MAEYKLPVLGETATQGIIAKILVAPGDSVAQDQTVLELETDKTVLEVPSTVAGVIGDILVKQGDTIKVGEPIFTFTNGAAAAPAPAAPAPAAPAPAAPAPAAPAAAAPAPAPAPVPAPPVSSGVSNVVTTNGTAPLSTPVQDDGVAGAGAPPTQTAPAPAAPTPAIVRDPAPAAPSVRRLARELGVDIHEVKGTGLGDRITEDDVKNFTRAKVVAAASAPAPAAGTAGPTISFPPLPDFSKFGATERIAFTGIRKATSDQMNRAWTIPHVTQFDKADATEFDAFRKKYGPLAEKAKTKLTPTAILLKVVVGALKKFPDFNASIDFSSNELVRKRYYNIGVAVDTPRGLVVPVIRDVDSKGIIELAVELNEVAERAREGKLKGEDFAGSSFTITNLGGIGGTNFTPIVNTPEVAILGVARGGIEPVWDAAKETFVPRSFIPFALSYDHRVINGADGARFLRTVIASVEDPIRIALEG